MHEMTQSWVEGGGNGTESEDGATWLTYDGSTSWPGGDIDGDYTVGTVLTSVAVTTEQSYT